MHKGGDVAFENVDWFNGGLFDDAATLRLETDELKLLAEAAQLDWSEIEPSIFGTLFERGLPGTQTAKQIRVRPTAMGTFPGQFRRRQRRHLHQRRHLVKRRRRRRPACDQLC